MEIKTLNEQIERLKELIRKCYGAVAGKNGTVPDVGERNMENLPAAIGSIKGITTDLVATENDKEYLPADYGVDAFGSVKTELRNLVKVSSFKVTDDCINEEGRWVGEGLMDTIMFTSFHSLFRGLTALKAIDLSSWDTHNVTNTKEMFYNSLNIENIDVRGWDMSNVTNMQGMFQGISADLDLSTWKTSGVVENTSYMFYAVKSKVLDLRNFDMSNATDVFRMFYSFNTPLTTIIGESYTIDKVINQNIKCLPNLKVSFDIHGLKNLERPSLRALINGLADVTDQPVESRPTLTLGAALMAKLTEEDRAIATSKGWDVA